MLCKSLLPLWSIPARMMINLDVIWLKGVFRINTGPFRTSPPHDLTKIKNKRNAMVIFLCFNSHMAFPSGNLRVFLEVQNIH